MRLERERNKRLKMQKRRERRGEKCKREKDKRKIIMTKREIGRGVK
jgi:hypothetical protein